MYYLALLGTIARCCDTRSIRDLIMPLSPSAKFDGRGAGFLVYPAGSAHSPTVTGGKALVLYLLPEGAIEFTRTP